MDHYLRVDPEHFEYLRIQKGSLDKYTGDFNDWHVRYVLDIRRTFQEVRPWLPEKCSALLDVGSGLGGVDILFWRHYAERNQQPFVCLLDGLADKPTMRLHRQTFNDMRIARNFHVKNGVNPLAFGCAGPGVTRFDQPFDLIVSFGSWCFHYPPRQYLERIRPALTPATVLILDVRAGKADWHDELAGAGLELVTMIRSQAKFSRCVFRVKP